MENTEPAALKVGVVCRENTAELYSDLRKYRNICRKFTNLWYMTECAQARINPEKGGQCEPRTFQMEDTLKDLIRQELLQLVEEAKQQAHKHREKAQTHRDKKEDKKAENQEAKAAEQDALAQKYAKAAENKHCDRNYIYQILEPNWMSCMGEVITSPNGALLNSKWRAMHPQIKGRRNFLAVNGKGDPILCKKVALPLKHTLWKFAKFDDGSSGVQFKIRRDLPPYELAFLGRKQKSGKRRLEPQQVFVLKQLGAIGDKGERWKRGDLLLTTDDSDRLRIVITYKRPKSSRKEDLDPNRVIEVSFDEIPEQFLNLRLISGKSGVVDDKRNWSESAVAAIQEIRRMEQHKLRLMKELMAASTNQTAKNEIRARQAKHAKRREKTQERWSGTWTSRIVHQALLWRAGEVQLKPTPSDAEQGSHLFGLPWGWYRFAEMLKYKCRKYGINLVLVEAAQKVSA